MSDAAFEALKDSYEDVFGVLIETNTTLDKKVIILQPGQHMGEGEQVTSDQSLEHAERSPVRVAPSIARTRFQFEKVRSQQHQQVSDNSPTVSPRVS